MTADSKDYSLNATPDAHAASHESGGSDEVDITGLTPADHASSHQNGGSDEVDASGLTGVGHQYVDRGDPSANDLDQGSMTLDSTWRDWDLSSIVPAGAVAVELNVRFMTNTIANKTLSFRKKGNSNAYNILSRKMQVAGGSQPWTGMVSCDSNRVIEYFGTASDADWTVVQLVIRGWWL